MAGSTNSKDLKTLDPYAGEWFAIIKHLFEDKGNARDLEPEDFFECIGRYYQDSEESCSWRRRAASNRHERRLWAQVKKEAAKVGRSTRRQVSPLAILVAKYGLTRFEVRLLLGYIYLQIQVGWTQSCRKSSTEARSPKVLEALLPPRWRDATSFFKYFLGSELVKHNLFFVDGPLCAPRINCSDEVIAALTFGHYKTGEHDGLLSKDGNKNKKDGLKSCRLWDAVEPRVKLADVILPEKTREQLEDALYCAKYPNKIFAGGYGKVIEKGRGLALLFYGKPGTGKSMAAEAFAAELGKKICVVRPDQVENLYVGQTEKNIVALFKEARKKDVVLLFDECDSLFYRRPPSANHSVDVYAGRVVNLLLRGIEEGEGLYILTTNREDYLDEALRRRLAAKIHFGIPDEEGRLALWRRLLPKDHSLTEEELVELARSYTIAGGDIKQICLAAARRAARIGQRVTVELVREAASSFKREVRHIGF